MTLSTLEITSVAMFVVVWLLAGDIAISRRRAQGVRSQIWPIEGGSGDGRRG